MSVFSKLFGAAPPIPLGELRSQIDTLLRAGRTKDALRQLERHRNDAERHYDSDETEKLYQNGVAHFLALTPLFEHSGDDGPEQFDWLKAFFASYTSMRITLGRAEGYVNADRRALIKDHFARAHTMYEMIYVTVDEALADAADTEANEEISAALRRSGLL